jgi:hypothetical protein
MIGLACGDYYPCTFYFVHGAMGAAGIRRFLRPLFVEGVSLRIIRARNASRRRERVDASEYAGRPVKPGDDTKYIGCSAFH